jgi:hypothetical protein
MDVSALVELGAIPATYGPEPEPLTVLNNSGVYFSISVRIENTWL